MFSILINAINIEKLCSIVQHKCPLQTLCKIVEYVSILLHTLNNTTHHYFQFVRIAQDPMHYSNGFRNFADE